MGIGRVTKTGTAVLALFTLLAVSTIDLAMARERSPHRAAMSLSKVYQIVARPNGNQEVEVIPTVKVQGRLHGVGFVDARFNIRRNKTWRSSIRKAGLESEDTLSPVLLQGKLAVGGAWKRSGSRILPSAASIIGNQMQVTFPGRAKGSKKTRQRFYIIKMTLDGTIVVKARISSIPKSIARRGACGAATGDGSLAMNGLVATQEANAEPAAGPDSSVIPAISADEAPISTVEARVITVSTDADQEWYQRYGDQSNAVIASYVNIAEAIYNRQFGLRFRLVKQHVYVDGSPYVSADAGDLLTTFVRNTENPTNLSNNPNSFDDEVDAKHLFTGKDMAGSIVGLAYVGVVCAAPSLTYGVTQAYMDVANAAIFAHELGHNFGASHDSTDRTGLMYPSISIPPAEKFSDTSVAEITSHLSKYGSCISLEQMSPRTDVTPSPDPIPTNPPLTTASLKIKRARIGSGSSSLVRISGQLISQDAQPLGTVGVRLMVSGEKVASAVTAKDGSFQFFVRMDLPKGKHVYVYVETEGSEVFSNFLWMSRTVSARQSRGRRSSR